MIIFIILLDMDPVLWARCSEAERTRSKEDDPETVVVHRDGN